VHARKTHELALEDVAHRDALTGLGNRHVLDRRLHELHDAGRTSVVLAYLDLDGFKQVNDAHGHEAGDAVLRVTGDRLLSLVRVDDVAVRLGGDEFVLACPVPSGTAAPAFAQALVERVSAAVCEPVEHAGLRLSVGASVGTALLVDSDPAAALHEADLAMYAAKRARARSGSGSPRFVPATAPADEAHRLQALRASRSLDAPPAQVLDDLVRAAALVAGTPSALVTLVDEHSQQVKAGCGLALTSTSRDVSFCGHVVAADRELHVADARRDPRFADNPLVTGGPGIRSYAGFPLRTAEGFVLGSLCVVGGEPRLLDEPQRAVLRLLAGQVMAALLREDERAAVPALPAQRAALTRV
jgi:diguanylate cyclase (GGDEF)-like protein